MMRIKHQWLSAHKFSAVALPTNHVPSDSIFELEQQDGSFIMVEKVPGGLWSFDTTDVPNFLTMVIFGLTADQMITLLKRKYPEFSQLPASEQTFHYLTIKRL